MIINIIVPKLHKDKYTGGILCIMHYANELHKKGHQINVIPSFPSDKPSWFKKPYGQLISLTKINLLFKLIKSIGEIVVSIIKFEPFLAPFDFRERTSLFISNFLLLIGSRFTSTNIENALSRDYLSQIMPKADHTIATTFQTALPVKAIGKGKKWYFCQHFEAYFANESLSPELSYIEAIASYHIGLRLIANSSWLHNKLSNEIQSEVYLCPNAIDQNVFMGKVKPIDDNKIITIISYGGRDAKWKGFIDMANAIDIARNKLLEYTLVWKVYGNALLSEGNKIAKYDSLGFLNSNQLANAYNEADILLSASWYESFPLFPIEAMTCGLPVITTQKGTEDYAIDKQTALIVEPKNPESIASAIIELVTDRQLRYDIATEGKLIAQKFTWKASGNQLEKILTEETAS